MVHFSTTRPSNRFRIFNESGLSYPLEKKASIEQCHRCWSYHPTKFCSRAPKCGRCASPNHREDVCPAEIARCANCCGPHHFATHNCLARPTRKNGQLVHRPKIQLQGIMEAGRVEYNRAVAERKAAAADLVARTDEALQASAKTILPRPAAFEGANIFSVLGQ